MIAKLTTRNLRRKRWFVRFEHHYEAITCRANYTRLHARNSMVWSGQCSRGISTRTWV